MLRNALPIVLVLFSAVFGISARAELTEDKKVELKQLAEGLRYQEGRITLPGNVATINLTDNFRYLDPKDSATVLTKIWGNPPDADVLGMLFPTGSSPLTRRAWAVVVSFEKSGYVKDNEAASLDYAKLLKQMQESTHEANAEREKQGYPTVELVDWATQPHYDQASHKIYWAKQIRFGGSSEDTLNYCIRALGRHGVLELNAVASMDQLHEVEEATPAILGMVNFEQGNRYADFNASTDKVATYGIAALIAGGVLAKTGLLKGLLVGILALKKFVIIGAVALIGFMKKLLAKFSPPKQRNLEARQDSHQ